MTESHSMDISGAWQAYLESIVQPKPRPGWQVFNKDGEVVNEGPGIELSGEGSS